MTEKIRVVVHYGGRSGEHEVSLRSAASVLRMSTQMDRVRSLAAEAFAALECSDFARVDFFLDRQTGQFHFNEINTLPGFTSISIYPKMMEASGVPYGELLTRLINLDRHRQRQTLARDYSS